MEENRNISVFVNRDEKGKGIDVNNCEGETIDLTNDDDYQGEDQAIFESRNNVRLGSSNMGEYSSISANRESNINTTNMGSILPIRDMTNGEFSTFVYDLSMKMDTGSPI